MSNGTVSHRKFSVPGGPHRHRGVFKWILIILVVLAGIAALNREWINFQIHVLMVKIGSSDTRTKSLHWFMENAPREARPVFFEVMLEDADLRQLAVNGLLESDQKELLPVYSTQRLGAPSSASSGEGRQVTTSSMRQASSRSLSVMPPASWVCSRTVSRG